MKLILFVEGDTERRLDPRITRPIRIAPVKFDGSGDYRKYFARRAKRFLASEDCFAVIGLLDLYGSGLAYSDTASRDAKYDWAKRKLERDVGDPHFRQHFAVHEPKPGC